MSISGSSTDRYQTNPLTSSVWMNEFTEYVTTTDGASDLFDVVGTGIEFAKRFSAKIRTLEIASKVQGLAGTVGSGLVFPDIISNINDLKNRSIELKNIVKLAFRGDIDPRCISRAFRKVFVKGLVLAGNVADAANFLHESQIIDLGRKLPIAGAVFNGAFMGADSIDVVLRVKKIQRNIWKSQIERNSDQKQIFKLKNHLNGLKILQDFSSIAMGGFGLAALFFGVTLTGMGAFAVGLGLPTAYLSLNITNHFFGRYIKYRIKNDD